MGDKISNMDNSLKAMCEQVAKGELDEEVFLKALREQTKNLDVSSEAAREAVQKQVETLELEIAKERDFLKEELERWKRDAELLSRTIEVSDGELRLRTRENNYLNETLEKRRKNEMAQAYDHEKEVEKWKDATERETTRASRAEYKSEAQAYSLDQANKTIRARDATIMKLNEKYGVESPSHFNGQHVVWEEEMSLKHMITVLNCSLEQKKEEAEARTAENKKLRKDVLDLQYKLKESENKVWRQDGDLREFRSRDAEIELRNSKAREAQLKSALDRGELQNINLGGRLKFSKMMRQQLLKENLALRQQATDALQIQIEKLRTQNAELQEIVEEFRNTDQEELVTKYLKAESRAKTAEKASKEAHGQIFDLVNRVINAERTCRDLSRKCEKAKLDKQLETGCDTEPGAEPTQNGVCGHGGHGLVVENGLEFDPSWQSVAASSPQKDDKEWFGSEDGKKSSEGDGGQTPGGDLQPGQISSTTPPESPMRRVPVLRDGDQFKID